MRIIAGKHRGKKLAAFRGTDIRPTPDRVKESLFQILSSRLEGARVLDLFAGSGALGLEALSRGAREVIFNDNSPEARTLIGKNLRAAGERGTVLPLSFRDCLLSVQPPFDLIFCDPPYKEDVAEDILTLVQKRELLAKNGLVVYESERDIIPPEGWEEADRRTYGRVKIALFTRSTT